MLLKDIYKHADEICCVAVPHGNSKAISGLYESIQMRDIYRLINVYVLLKGIKIENEDFVTSFGMKYHCMYTHNAIICHLEYFQLMI